VGCELRSQRKEALSKEWKGDFGIYSLRDAKHGRERWVEREEREEFVDAQKKLHNETSADVRRLKCRVLRCDGSIDRQQCAE
jgi:hypothetical protein